MIELRQREREKESVVIWKTFITYVSLDNVWNAAPHQFSLHSSLCNGFSSTTFHDRTYTQIGGCKTNTRLRQQRLFLTCFVLRSPVPPTSPHPLVNSLSSGIFTRLSCKHPTRHAIRSLNLLSWQGNARIEYGRILFYFCLGILRRWWTLHCSLSSRFLFPVCVPSTFWVSCSKTNIPLCRQIHSYGVIIRLLYIRLIFFNSISLLDSFR